MPPYRLQTLLELRERAREAAEHAFAQAVQKLEREKQKLEKMKDALERRTADRKEKAMANLAEVLENGAGAGGLTLLNRFDHRLKDEEAQLQRELDHQRDVVVKQAAAAVEMRRQEMAEAAVEHKAIEKHKETWLEQVKKERELREELTHEEIGNALHLMRSRK